tara:strand:- start:741 stop:1298 length:558 start_codon:yes stop_codon:yes gene_type:complete
MSENKKVSLYSAGAALSSLMELAGDDTLVESHLMEEMRHLQKDAASAIDRRKFLIAEADVRVQSAKKMIEEIKLHMNKLKKLKQRIKENTIKAIQDNPKINFRDSIGRKINVRESSGKLVIKLQTKMYSVQHCVDPDLENNNEIRPYLQKKTFFCINADRLKLDLEIGKDLSFAELKKSKIITGL